MRTPSLIILSLLVFIFLALPGSVRAGGASLDGYGYIKGANMPWIDGYYYNDIAANPHYPGYGVGFSAMDFSNDLAGLHSMGVTVVRFWVNTDDQGCLLNSSGYVTNVTTQFWTNLDTIVSLAASNSITLYLTLNEGRTDWLTNTAMANAYKTNCLVEMIQRYKGNPGVFGIDLMNEIDNCVADPVMGNPWIGSGATWPQAQAYITNFSSAIHNVDPNRLVSCSQVYHGWANLPAWKGLGLDFYDFHYYEDSISFPPVASLNVDKPVYVGECGQANADLTWSDPLQTACELEALNSTYNGGYAGASIWAYALPDWQTDDYIQYAMLNTNGTWREVCYAMQNWSTSTAPDISTFSPSTGTPGTTVIINGVNLTGTTNVTFDGVTASFTVNSSTQITATVPVGTATGPITVTTHQGPATSTANFTPLSNLIIYDDTLGFENGFDGDYSWATVNDYNTSPIFSGSYSISVSAPATYDALSLYNPGGFNTAPYTALNFWINGGASGASGIQVLGVVGENDTGYTNLPALPANTWVQFTLPLSSLGVANISDCNGFWFWPTTSTSTFYVAAVQLVVAVPMTLSPVSFSPVSGKFIFQLTGGTGQNYEVETSSNLVNWTILSTNTLTANTVTITNTVLPGVKSQFWRIAP